MSTHKSKLFWENLREETATQQSLIMLKPDAFERNLVHEIEKMIFTQGLTIVQRKIIYLNRWNLLELWPKIHTLWGWLASQQYHLGQRLEVWEVEGNDAINKTLQIKALLRHTYCDPSEIMRKLIHSPDTVEDFERERIVLFTLPSRLEDFNDYQRSSDELSQFSAESP